MVKKLNIFNHLNEREITFNFPPCVLNGARKKYNSVRHLTSVPDRSACMLSNVTISNPPHWANIKTIRALVQLEPELNARIDTDGDERRLTLWLDTNQGDTSLYGLSPDDFDTIESNGISLDDDARLKCSFNKILTICIKHNIITAWQASISGHSYEDNRPIIAPDITISPTRNASTFALRPKINKPIKTNNTKTIHTDDNFDIA